MEALQPLQESFLKVTKQKDDGISGEKINHANGGLSEELTWEARRVESCK